MRILLQLLIKIKNKNMTNQQQDNISWQEKFVSRFSGKSDAHRYLTGLPELAKHEELFKTPHLRSLYSQSFTNTMAEGRAFC